MTINPVELINALATDDAVRADPFSLYRNAASMGEIVSIFPKFSIATSYDAVNFILRSSQFGKRPTDGSLGRRSIFNEKYPPSMLFSDPPNHTRLRRSVARLFTPSKIDAMTPQIEELTETLFARFIQSGGGDFVSEVALEIPVSVISLLLGVNPSDRPSLAKEVAIVAASLDLSTQFTGDEERVIEAGNILLEYFEALVRSKDEKGAVLASLLEGDDPLDVYEASVMALLLFMAGFETTANLLSSIIYSMGSDEEIRATVTGASDLRASVEEFLRLDSPVQIDGRLCQVESRYNDVKIDEGTFVLTLIGGANRDPKYFEDPDSFSLGRKVSPILSFATGIHHCIGATLARSEGEIFLRHLLDMPTYDIVKAVRKPTLTLRGFQSIEVVL
ncbi:MAG: cytochrome P450 [Actinomycetota bacterium]|nr:cytochrome P450 [Actinomycetota bacterium]